MTARTVHVAALDAEAFSVNVGSEFADVVFEECDGQPAWLLRRSENVERVAGHDGPFEALAEAFARLEIDGPLPTISCSGTPDLTLVEGPFQDVEGDEDGRLARPWWEGECQWCGANIKGEHVANGNPVWRSHVYGGRS